MDKVVLDFSSPAGEGLWETVNDVVMGGLSRSRFYVAPGGFAVFEGEVSLDNSGGFASARTLPAEFGLGGHAGLSLRVRGDGRSYRLRLRTDDHFDGPAYQAGFDTRPGEWVVIRLPFESFTPVFRGRAVSGAPPLGPERVRRIGIMIADRQEGAFRLEIAWIKAFQA